MNWLAWVLIAYIAADHARLRRRVARHGRLVGLGHPRAGRRRMIRATDYAALIAARATLSDAADDLDHAANESGADAASLARVAVLCEVADKAIFHALVAAQIYLEDPEAGAALFPERGAS